MPRQLPNPRSEGNDQNFLTFMLLAAMFLLLGQSFFGQRPQPPKPDDQAAADAQPEADDEGTATDEPVVDDNALAEDIEALPEPEQQLVAIGSANVNGPFRMLLTLDNRGGAIRRAELSTKEFRDLDDRSGYLGELALVESDAGSIVSIVGPGTPAAQAGLQAGDLIADAEKLRQRLSNSKPGETFDFEVVRNDKTVALSAKLTRRPLAIMRPESENVLLHNPKLAADVTDLPSFLVQLTNVGELNAENSQIVAANEQLTTGNWRVVASDGRSVTFGKRLVELGLEVEKTFTLVELPEEDRSNADYPGYHFNFEVQVKNLLSKKQSVAYAIRGPNGLPIEGWWYANRIGRKESGSGSWGAVGIRDVVARYKDSNFIEYRCNDIVKEKAKPMGQGAPMAYIGVDAQYFSVVMIPAKDDLSEVWFDNAIAELATPPKLPEEGTLPTYNNTTFTANRKAVELAAAGEGNAVHSDSFQVFAGPKRPDLLKQYIPAGDENYSLSNLLYYGWFHPVAAVMLRILHFFHEFIPNYGICIIMLTVLVRSCMFPLSRKQAMNMAKMQELKPEMERIKKKYKDDMQKQSSAQQELFRKHNYNPMGGCLLMFFQLPIFIGLYRALAVDIELRQAPLISESVRFCSNLAAPDQLLEWSSWMPRWWNNGQSFGLFPGLGPYFNLLPIVTIVLFLLQQKMFMPEATDEQTRLQQKMMKYMMVIFGLMFFKVPSGLCLYFIASSIWGITERKLLPKPTPPSESAGFSKPAPSSKSPEKATSSKKANKSSSAKASGSKKKKKKRR